MSRRGHGGGHGASWKVAYADFVTSMMAFFLVMWLVSADPEIREAVQDYFSGVMKRPGGQGAMKQPVAGPKVHPKQGLSQQEIQRLQELQRTSEKLQEMLRNSDEAGEDLIRFEFLADGIRIIALDKSKRPFFEPGTDALTKFGEFVLKTIAWEVERHPFFVEVEGHTQKGIESETQEKSDWDLSTRRAISAQKSLMSSGVEPEKFFRVAGYADKIPVDRKHPESEENRRISIVIRPGSEEDLFRLSEEPKKKDMFE